MSDIHGNRTALQKVLDYADGLPQIDACILLGDIVDYGMHTNEVVQILSDMKYLLVCNIRGNHEQAIISEDYTRFSTQRGKECAKYTSTVLNDRTRQYLKNIMSDCGKAEFVIEGKKCLAVHGSLEDIYWKSIKPGQNLESYREYDYVFSGHSHIPHFMEEFYEADAPLLRNKKKTLFINPGSVGQPRNLNPMAQFAVLDTRTEEVWMKKVYYDVRKEQEAYKDQVDGFYSSRLEYGV